MSVSNKFFFQPFVGVTTDTPKDYDTAYPSARLEGATFNMTVKHI